MFTCSLISQDFSEIDLVGSSQLCLNLDLVHNTFLKSSPVEKRVFRIDFHADPFFTFSLLLFKLFPLFWK